MGKKRTVVGVALVGVLSALSAGCVAEVEPTESEALPAMTPVQFISDDRYLTDATIAKAAPNTNYGASGSCVADAGSTQRACFIRWDLSSRIPPTATVLAAYIRFEVFNPSAAIFKLDQVYGTWDELPRTTAPAHSGITWNSRGSAGPWNTPGARNAADRAFAPFAQFKGTLGVHEIQVLGEGLKMIQRWVWVPASNAGIVIDNINATDGIEIRTKEATTGMHPQIHIIYQMP
jgi:hypothetical protein